MRFRDANAPRRERADRIYSTSLSLRHADLSRLPHPNVSPCTPLVHLQQKQEKCPFL